MRITPCSSRIVTIFTAKPQGKSNLCSNASLSRGNLPESGRDVGGNLAAETANQRNSQPRSSNPCSFSLIPDDRSHPAKRSQRWKTLIVFRMNGLKNNSRILVGNQRTIFFPSYSASPNVLLGEVVQQSRKDRLRGTLPIARNDSLNCFIPTLKLFL